MNDYFKAHIPKVGSSRYVVDFAKDTSSSYNVAVGAQLTGSAGLVPYVTSTGQHIECPGNIVAVWTMSPTTPYILLDDQGYLYRYSDEQCAKVQGERVVGYRCGMVSGNVLVICGSQYAYSYDGNTVSIATAPIMTHLAVHYGRMYGIAGIRLYFSKLLDATSWGSAIDGGGYIDMPISVGQCVAIVSKGKYLYAICQHGIMRLLAQSDVGRFELKQIYVNMPLVYDNTVTMCGEHTWWLSADGVYQFDGNNLSLMTPLPQGVSYKLEDACCGYANGQYMVAMRCNYSDNRVVGCDDGANNSVLCVDISTKTAHIMRGYDVKCFVRIDGMAVLCVGDDRLYTLLPTTSHKQWDSNALCLCQHAHQRIDSMHIITKHPVTLTVTNGLITNQYQVLAGTNRVGVRMRGGRFALSISTDSEHLEVSSVEIHYTTFGNIARRRTL